MHQGFSDYTQMLLTAYLRNEAYEQSAHDSPTRSVSERTQCPARDRMRTACAGFAMAAGIVFIWFVTGK